MSSEFDSLSSEDKLKFSLYHYVSKACDDVGQNNSLLGEFSLDKRAKEMVAELIWKKLQMYAEDLEAFALHAKRNTIGVEDLKLLFRRNPKLLEEFEKLDKEEDEEDSEEETEEKVKPEESEENLEPKQCSDEEMEIIDIS